MKFTLRSFAVPILLLACAITAIAQQGQNSPSASGHYGFQAWAINNQRVASQFNYQVPSTWSRGLGAFTFPSKVCTNLYNFSGRGGIPWNLNATVTINDGNSTLTETDALTAFSNSTGYCTLTLTQTNAHVGSYVLTSGTCGLREALNDLQGYGGEVIVDQQFYDAGCTAATITGLTQGTSTSAGPLLGNQYIHDISAGQDTWYGLKPTTLTLIPATGVALTATITAGASSYYLNYEYVDPVGGQGLPNTESAQLTSAALPITTSAVAAATGAVGWIPMITSSTTGTELAVPVTSTVCKLSTLETIIPACAIGATATIATYPTGGSLENVEAWGHTTTGYQPLPGPPSIAASTTSGSFQTSFGPFVVGSTLNSSNEDLAQWYVPGWVFNSLDKSWDICVKGATATQVASSVLAIKLNAATLYGQSAVTISTITFPTQTEAAAGTFGGCFTIQTNTTQTVAGATGKFWSVTPQAWSMALSSAPGTLVQAIDVTTAASSAIDLTKGIFFSINAAETIGHNITGPIINAVTIKPTAAVQ